MAVDLVKFPMKSFFEYFFASNVKTYDKALTCIRYVRESDNLSP